MPTTQAHAGKNTPYEKVKSYSSLWLSKSAVRSPHRGRAEAEVPFGKCLQTSHCLRGHKRQAGLDQPKPGRDKYLPSVYGFKCFFRSNPFMALAMQTSPGLGCISFPSRLPVKMSRTLMWPPRAGTTMRVRTNKALAI